MPVPQQLTIEHRPIVFVLFNLNLLQVPSLVTFLPVFIVFESGGRGIIRPQELSITRPGRGLLINTAEGAFLDDFGEGVASINMAGHTGFDQGGGLGSLKLIEQAVIDYHLRRQLLRNVGLDPSTVKLWFIDTLNYEAFSVYPQEFVVERSRAHPLWVYYRMRMVGLLDLLEEGEELLLDFIGGVTKTSTLLPSLDKLSNEFLNIVKSHL